MLLGAVTLEVLSCDNPGSKFSERVYRVLVWLTNIPLMLSYLIIYFFSILNLFSCFVFALTWMVIVMAQQHLLTSRLAAVLAHK